MILSGDVMNSSKVYIEGVLQAGIPVLAYNGAWDGVVGAAVSEPLYASLTWAGAEEFRATPRKPWKVDVGDIEVAGFASEISVPISNGGGGGVGPRPKQQQQVARVARFARAVVRRAGHILPADEPSAAFDMIDRFITGRGWATSGSGSSGGAQGSDHEL
jgi:vitellogenic carboxypeptidase-like protein